MKNTAYMRTKNSEPDKIDDSGSEIDAFFITERILTKSLDVTLPEEVLSFGRYLKLLKDLRDLPDRTTEVNLYLSNDGGLVSGGLPLFRAFRQCKVPVHVHIIGDCYSMGAILALCGSTLTFDEGTILMYHNYSGGHFGKGKELVDAAKESYTSFWRTMNSMLIPFLTQKEVNTLKKDGDVYVHWDDKDLQERIARHFGGKK